MSRSNTMLLHSQIIHTYVWVGSDQVVVVNMPLHTTHSMIMYCLICMCNCMICGVPYTHMPCDYCMSIASEVGASIRTRYHHT